MPAFFEKNSVGEQGDFTDCGAQVEIYSEIGSSSGDDFREMAACQAAGRDVG
jgi:hypothetical protein